jgi:internalin A
MSVTNEVVCKSWWHRLRVAMSLRALMALVLAIGGGLGWVAYRARVQREVVAAIKAAGGSVDYGWDWPEPRSYQPPRWLMDALGPDYFGAVVSVNLVGNKADDALLARISRLDRLEHLFLYNSRSVTDAGLAHLQRLSRLEWLGLERTGVTGPGLIHLKGLSRLKELWLSELPITDADLAPLAGLTSLEILVLRETRLTDAGLKHLAGLTNLIRLSLEKVPITSAGLDRLGVMRELRFLHLSGTKVDRIDSFRLSTKLEVLDLASTPFNDAGFSRLPDYLSLMMLGADKTAITDKGLADLIGLKGPTTLSIQETHVTPEGGASLEAKRPKMMIVY